MPTQSVRPEEEVASHIGCMELCGGAGPGEGYYQRPGLDVWVSCLSAGMTHCGGGDLHLISSCASGRITRLLLADICGAGDQFRDVSDGLRAVMRRHINRVQQKGCVTAMGENLQQASDDGAFASTLLATYFSPTRSLHVCNAGHPAPLVCRNTEQQWQPIEPGLASSRSYASETALDLTEYRESSTRLAVGDRVLFYSGTLSECADQNGNLLGDCGIRRLVESSTRQGDELTAKGLLSQIASWNPHLAATGDATVVLCRATTRGTTWQDNLFAPLRLLRRAVDRVTID